MMIDDPWYLTSTSHTKTGPKYSFPGGPQLAGERRKDIPGPGTYAQTSTAKDKFRRSSSWAMGTSTRDTGSGVFQPPGPGAYSPKLNKDSQGGKKPAEWVFGTDKKLPDAKSRMVPGPGAYETHHGVRSGKLISMTWKNFPDQRPRPTPGPNDYKVKGGYNSGLAHIQSTPKISFGTSCRSDMLINKTPGPGSYELPTSLCGNISTKTPPKYSIKSKPPLLGQEGTPGYIVAGSQFDVRKHLPLSTK